MFFYVSKILEIFIYPVTWILFLLIAALFVKKPRLKKGFVIASVALLLFFSDDFILNQFARHWDVKQAQLKASDTYSCAIVLGGFSMEGTHGDFVFNVSADRFIQALKLYTTGKVSHILITGGNGSLIPDYHEEGDWAETQLKLFKVPDSCILIEDKSRNTLENAAFTKPILKKAGLQPPYLLVTSAFHMRRALGIFKKDDIKVIPYPCNYLAGTGNAVIEDFIPDGKAFGIWNYYVKEVVGTMVNSLR